MFFARRIALVVALPLLLQAPAAPRLSSPRSVQSQKLAQWADAKAAADDWTVTARELAFSPVPADATANRQHLRSVLDAMDAARRKLGAGDRRITLHFPDRTSWVDRPLIADTGNLRLQGDGPNATLRMVRGRDDALLVLGVPRKFAGRSFTPDHWYSLAGRLDSSVTSQKWGLRTRGNAHVASMAGYWSYPAGYWATSPGVTLNLLLDSTDAPIPVNVPLGGLSERGIPSPWLAWTQANRIVFMIRVIRPDGSPRTFSAYVPMPTERGVHRYTVQIDLASGVCTAIVDGTVSHPRVEAGVETLPAGSKFPANQSTPFLIGAFGGNSNSIAGDISTVTGRDIAVGGLKVSDRAEYREDGTRLDNRPDTDQLRYFSQTPGTLGYLTLADDPATVAADRFVAVACGGRQATALYLSDEHSTPFSALGPTELRDLRFIATASGWGQCVSLGYALYVDARDCVFTGGAHGFGSARFGANYTIRLRDCTASGTDAALFNDYGMWTVDRLHIPSHGRATVRVDAGLLEGRDWFVEYAGTPEYFLRSNRGGNVQLDRVHIDIESGPYPTKAYFYAEGGGQNPGGVAGTLKLHDVTLGLIQPQQTLIRLRPGGGSGYCRVDVQGLSWVGGTDRTKLFDIQGTRWRGTIRVDQPVSDVSGVPAGMVDQP